MEDITKTGRMSIQNKDIIQLYSAATPNGIKVAACLEELCSLRSHKEDFDYEPHSIDIRDNESRTPGYTKIAPHGKIPAILDPHGPNGESIKIWESGAILQYLAEKYHELLPCDDLVSRTECIKWLFWGSTAVSSQFKAFGFYYKYCPHKVEYCIKRTTREVLRLLTVLENQLGSHGKHWIIGDVYTIADIAIWPWVYALHQNYDDAIKTEFNDLKAFPYVKEWYARCIGRPASLRSLEVAPFVA